MSKQHLNVHQASLYHKSIDKYGKSRTTTIFERKKHAETRSPLLFFSSSALLINLINHLASIVITRYRRRRRRKENSQCLLNKFQFKIRYIFFPHKRIPFLKYVWTIPIFSYFFSLPYYVCRFIYIYIENDFVVVNEECRRRSVHRKYGEICCGRKFAFLYVFFPSIFNCSMIIKYCLA